MLRASHSLGIALALAGIVGCAACNGEKAMPEPAPPDTTQVPGDAADADLEADTGSDVEVDTGADADAGTVLPPELQALFEQAGAGPLRVIVSGRADLDDPAAVEQVTARLSQAAREAGVEMIDPIEGEPTLVMKASREQLEAIWATGLVEDIQLDRATGINPP